MNCPWTKSWLRQQKLKFLTKKFRNRNGCFPGGNCPPPKKVCHPTSINMWNLQAINPWSSQGCVKSNPRPNFFFEKKSLWSLNLRMRCIILTSHIIFDQNMFGTTRIEFCLKKKKSDENVMSNRIWRILYSPLIKSASQFSYAIVLTKKTRKKIKYYELYSLFYAPFKESFVL